LETITIALAGQPNVGKSSLINAISNAKLKVGNFSGVTVDKTEIEFSLYDDDIECKTHMIDLPGAYSLTEYTIEEKITKNFIQNSNNYDIILNVVDSTNLQRNLLFTTQLLETGKKVIVVLNMDDEAQKEGINIDEKKLSKILGVPCIKTSSVTKNGIKELKQAILKTYKKDKTEPKIVYSQNLEDNISNVIATLEKRYLKSDFLHRHLAIKLLQEDKGTFKLLRGTSLWKDILPVLKFSIKDMKSYNDTDDIRQIFANEHLSFVKGAAMDVTKRKNIKSKNITQTIDNILTDGFMGIPIFLFFMWGLFQLTFELGSLPMDYIEQLFSWLGDLAKGQLGDGVLGSLVADGIIAGVGAVMMFLPNILILFIGIALLETTGYMSRVAFLLDGFFNKFGLQGKSFIPLVTGFGCSVPAYMAARTLKNETDRLITLFVIGFMSCGAKLPIYVLFAAAFFSQEEAGNILFIIYISGALLGLIMAKVLKVFVFKGEDEPFVMEMPKYRMPSFKLIYITVYSQAKSYVKKAGTFILAASILIWFASNYPKNPKLSASFDIKIEQAISEDIQKELRNQLSLELLEQSYLGKVGHFSEPLFAPLGFDWKMTVALETGLAAKEIVVSTLGILYALGDDVDEESQGLVAQLNKNIPFPSAIAFIVFVMIYLPCLAASMVFAKEAGGWKYLVYLFFMTSGSAWILSFLAYHVATYIELINNGGV